MFDTGLPIQDPRRTPCMQAAPAEVWLEVTGDVDDTEYVCDPVVDRIVDLQQTRGYGSMSCRFVRRSGSR